MSKKGCKHPDIRKFDGIRCCLACGEAVFEAEPARPAADHQTGTNDPYRYSKLNYALGQEIRLCVLLPGDPEDDLSCEVVHVNLEDDPEYDAVSYTWATEDGDASLSKIIRCVPSGTIKISSNCDAVLRQLRKHWLERRIWIDSISIDQANVNERNHQVGLMDQIYKKAQTVRLCIPEIPDVSDWALHELFVWLAGSGHAESRSIVPAYLRSTWERFLSMRYFSRAWVIQEIIHARVANLHIKKEEIHFTSKVREKIHSDSLFKQYRVPGTLRLDPRDRVEFDIWECLLAGFRCESTDPRDKVFAVWGLMEPGARSMIRVNYAATVNQVFSNAVVATVICNRDLEALVYTVAVEEANATGGPDGVPATTRVLTIELFLRYLSTEKLAMYSGFHLVDKARDHDAARINYRKLWLETPTGPWRKTNHIVSDHEMPEITTVDDVDLLSIVDDVDLLSIVDDTDQLSTVTICPDRMRLRA